MGTYRKTAAGEAAKRRRMVALMLRGGMRQEEVSEVLSKKHGLNGDEQKGILRHLIEGADLSLWGMANAFTHQSQDVESYDRATELEAIGGNIITLAKSEYWELLAA